jgi:hypothetical protein
MDSTRAIIEILAAIAIPALAFALNWQIRIKHDYILTAAADFILAIAAFDFAALAAHDVFEKAVHAETFQKEFVPLFIVLFVFTLGAWLFAFLPLEDRLIKVYVPSSGGRFTGKSALYFFGAWALVGMLIAPQAFVFLYR